MKYIWDDSLIEILNSKGFYEPIFSNRGSLLQVRHDSWFTINDIEELEKKLNIEFVTQQTVGTPSEGVTIFRIKR